MEESSEDALFTALVDFLEVAIHEFIYNWRVYPSNFFDRWKKYDVPVHICRHPKLIEYIRGVLKSSRSLILDGSVEKLTIAVRSSSSGLLLDSCVFELKLQTYSSKEMPKQQLDEMFRRILVQMSAVTFAHVTQEKLRDDDERTFRLYLHTIEDSETNETIVTDEAVQHSWIMAPQDEISLSQAAIIPIASSNDINLPLKLNMYLIQQESTT